MVHPRFFRPRYSALNASTVSADVALTVPEQAGNVVGWWDFSDSTTVTVETGDVAQLDDKIASNDALQADNTKRPQFLAATINGLDCASFDGADESLYSTTSTGLSGFDDFTVMGVFANSSATNNKLVCGVFDKTTAVGIAWYISILASSNRVFAFASANGSTGLSVTNTALSVGNTTVPYFWAYRHIRGAPSSRTVYVNDTSTESTVDFDATIYTSTEDFNLGQYAAGAFFNGRMCETIIYNEALSDTNLTTVKNYLKTKWGVT